MNVCGEEVQYILKFYYKKSKNAMNVANNICEVYGPNAVSISVAQTWFKQASFKSRNFSVNDEVCFKRPVTDTISTIRSLRK